MTVTEATLTEITRRLVATYQPEQVVLFGSHAWGEPDADSDVTHALQTAHQFHSFVSAIVSGQSPIK